MTDRREQMLARMAELFVTVASAHDGSSFRNRGALEHDKRPAIVLLDGGERTDPGAFGRSRGSVFKNIAIATPEIYVLLKERLNNTNVGPELNQWRARIYNALVADAALQSILGTNGGIDYLGCETDMRSGRTGVGELRIDLSLSYVVDPRELAEET